MNPPFNLRELRYFVTIAELGGPAPAAAVLRTREATVSRVLQRLETGLAMRLLERDGRGAGVALTAAGRAFYEKASEVLSAADAAVAAVGPWARGESKVLIALPQSAQGLARPLRRSFMQRHPGVAIESVRVRGGDRLAALRAGSVDVALTYPAPRGNDLVTARVHASPRYALLGERHRLAGRSRLRFAEIASELVANGLGDDGGRAARRRFDPPAAAETSSGLERLWALAYAGRTVVVLPRFMLAAVTGDGVRAVPLVDVEPLEVVLARRREDRRGVVSALLDAARAASGPALGGSAERPRVAA